jgi:exodeoxyribonuclease VII small subunit
MPAEALSDRNNPVPADEAELGFDQVLERLRQVVGRLEQGSLPLEQALRSFEEGVRLSRRGSSILDAAEHRVELLLKDEAGSEIRQPLPGSTATGGD